MVRMYESIIVFFPELDDAAIEGEMKKVEETIKGHKGSVNKAQVCGKRQLSYKIKKQEFGIYVHIVFDSAPTVVSSLDRQLRINEVVLRHLIVKKDKYAPDSDVILREAAGEEEHMKGRFNHRHESGVGNDKDYLNNTESEITESKSVEQIAE